MCLLLMDRMHQVYALIDVYLYLPLLHSVMLFSYISSPALIFWQFYSLHLAVHCSNVSANIIHILSHGQRLTTCAFNWFLPELLGRCLYRKNQMPLSAQFKETSFKILPRKLTFYSREHILSYRKHCGRLGKKKDSF